MLSRERAQKYGIDLDVAAANLQKLKAVAPAVQTIFAELAAERRSNDAAAPSADPDRSLYSGFASSGDKARFVQIRSMMPEHLAAEAPKFRFDDQKFAEMLFRFRARNWPEMPQPKRLNGGGSSVQIGSCQDEMGCFNFPTILIRSMKRKQADSMMMKDINKCSKHFTIGVKHLGTV